MAEGPSGIEQVAQKAGSTPWDRLKGFLSSFVSSKNGQQVTVPGQRLSERVIEEQLLTSTGRPIKVVGRPGDASINPKTGELSDYQGRVNGREESAQETSVQSAQAPAPLSKAA